MSFTSSSSATAAAGGGVNNSYATSAGKLPTIVQLSSNPPSRTSSPALNGSTMSDRRPLHSRESSWDKHFPRVNGVNGNSSRDHSRHSSHDSKKYDDIIPHGQRRSPPTINILPTSTPSTRRNSQDGNPLSWATEKLTLGSQSSKRLLTKSLTKLSTSVSPTWNNDYDNKSPSTDRYYSSPAEKAFAVGCMPYSHYPHSFRSHPLSYTYHHGRYYLHQYILKPRRLFTIIVGLFLIIYLFRSALLSAYRSTRYLGGGSKFVIILAANQGGGVLNWKGAKEWAVERESIQNKKLYAEKHGYHLEIRDMKSLKRYAHEWRESWEKVDVLRAAMKKYPHAEWFWYLDIQTYIMEPEISLQKHIFNKLEKVTYRDINKYNPINITHPPTQKWLDDVSRSKVGDGDSKSISLIVPQDCGGFNLGSFFARRGEFMDRLMDVWWDPVGYEQMHMQWDHKEQDVLEHIYVNQPWTRNGIAFIPQRMINSFPPGACDNKRGDPNIFYAAEDRDFLVNMAGCEWGRDCAEEMKKYKEVSEKLNRRKGWFW